MQTNRDNVEGLLGSTDGIELHKIRVITLLHDLRFAATQQVKTEDKERPYPRNASGDIVPGFIVLMATSTTPRHLPYHTSPKLPSPSFCFSCS